MSSAEPGQHGTAGHKKGPRNRSNYDSEAIYLAIRQVSVIWILIIFAFRH